MGCRFARRLSISISFQIHLQSSVFSPRLQRIPECGSVIYYICAVNVEHKMHQSSIMDRMTCCLLAHISSANKKCRGKGSGKSGGNGKKARSRISPNALFKSSLRGIHYTSCLLRQPSCGQWNINGILLCRSWANISVVHRPAANAPLSSAMTSAVIWRSCISVCAKKRRFLLWMCGLKMSGRVCESLYIYY